MSVTIDLMLRALYEGNAWKKLRKKIKNMNTENMGKIIRPMISRKNKVEDNTIIFMTTQGSYNCNAKAIADEIIRQELPFKLYWVARNENLLNTLQYPECMNLVIRGSFDYHIAAAKSKIWIDNSVSMHWLGTVKKKNQIMFETWHGSIGLKRNDAEAVQDKKWIKMAKETGPLTDYCISNSDFEDKIYGDSYWKNIPILKYGHPRNDILCDNHKEERKILNQKIRKIYHIDKDTKILLYAPTFRDSNAFTPYNLDYEKVQEALTTRFGGKWCIMTRFHFKVRKLAEQYGLPSDVIDTTSYEDIQDLMAIANVGLTDYSSWICDYSLTSRPGFIFATDLADYDNERGFYYPLNTTPFPIATNNKQLVANILNFDADLFIAKNKEYLNEHGCIDDGHASERVVAKIKEVLENN